MAEKINIQGLKKGDIVAKYYELLDRYDDLKQQYDDLDGLYGELETKENEEFDKEQFKEDILNEMGEKISKEIKFNTELQDLIFETIKNHLIDYGYEFYALDEYVAPEKIHLGGEINIKIGDVILEYVEKIM